MSGIFKVGRIGGSRWYTGDAIKGIGVDAVVYEDSGINNSRVGDMYLNTGKGTSRGRVYTCVTPGGANEATWAYAGSVRGDISGIINNLDTESEEHALSAAMGKALKDKISSVGIKPTIIHTRRQDIVYTVQLEIDNGDTSVFITDYSGNKGTYEYKQIGSAATAIILIPIGTSIGFESSGNRIKTISTDGARIHQFALLDANSEVIYSEKPDIWERLSQMELDIESGAEITDIQESESEIITTTYKTSNISKFTDGVRTEVFPVTHARATWWNKADNINAYEHIDSKEKEAATIRNQIATRLETLEDNLNTLISNYNNIAAKAINIESTLLYKTKTISKTSQNFKVSIDAIKAGRIVHLSLQIYSLKFTATRNQHFSISDVLPIGYRPRTTIIEKRYEGKKYQYLESYEVIKPQWRAEFRTDGSLHIISETDADIDTSESISTDLMQEMYVSDS